MKQPAQAISQYANRPTIIAWVLLIPICGMIMLAAVVVQEPLLACLGMPVVAFFVLAIGVLISWQRVAQLRARTAGVCSRCSTALQVVHGVPQPTCMVCGLVNHRCFACGYDLANVPPEPTDIGRGIPVQPPDATDTPPAAASAPPTPQSFRRCPECGLLNSPEQWNAVIRSTV